MTEVIDRAATDRRPSDVRARLALLHLTEPPAIAERRTRMLEISAELEQRLAAATAAQVAANAADVEERYAAERGRRPDVVAARERARQARRTADEHADRIAALREERDGLHGIEVADFERDVREIDERRRQVEALEITAPLAEQILTLQRKLTEGIAAANRIYPHATSMQMRDLRGSLNPDSSGMAANTRLVAERLPYARRALAAGIAAFRQKWGV